MKDEINEILDFLELDGGLAILRDEFSILDSSESKIIRHKIQTIYYSIAHEFPANHDHIGLYHLLIGCCHYELDELEQADESLNKAIMQISEFKINRSIAHWLAGMICSDSGNYPKARKEIREAYNLTQKQNPYSSRINKENTQHQKLRDVFDNRSLKLQNTLLYNYSEASIKQKNTYPLQEKQEVEDKSPSVMVVNENYPTNKFTVHRPDVGGENEAQKMDEEEQVRQNENRTDDSNFIYIQSLPVYEQKARAGNSGEIELALRPESYTEIQQVLIDNKLHNLHSLRRDTKRINITTNARWGWMGVSGKSMNKVNIEAGDHILFRESKNANDNDIVIAHYLDRETNDLLVTVKRYNKADNFLVSETAEKGGEYEPIDIKEKKASILGIVYAVAKPA